MQLPQKPTEIWGLWSTDGQDGGYWIPATDEVGDGILAFASLENATKAAKFHEEHYEAYSTPVRIV